MKPFEFHPEAEVDESSDYYESQRPGVGDRFVGQIDFAIGFICQFPAAGRFDSSTGTRRRSVNRFPFTIHYIDEPNLVWIVAVVHNSRRPGYWKHRLNGH